MVLLLTITGSFRALNSKVVDSAPSNVTRGMLAATVFFEMIFALMPPKLPNAVDSRINKKR